MTQIPRQSLTRQIKWDGFRSLAYVENGRCRLVSRNGNEFKSFPVLNVALPLECRAKRAVLDGEIVAWTNGAIRNSGT